jgi:glycosyltransferase involved in cell wall biosynthesis
MVDKFPPLPADDGGKLRSFAVLRRLADRGPVVLCSFDRPEADRGALARLGVELRTVPWTPGPIRNLRGSLRTGSGSAGRFWDGRLATTIREAMAEAPTDVFMVEHGQLGRYLKLGRAGRRVLDLHNVDSDLAASYARSARPPRAQLAGLESRLLRRMERAALASADVVVTVSEEDAGRLAADPAEVLVCPNGWEPGPVLPPAAAPVVLFTALFGWRPNVDAAVWFVTEVWPAVVARCRQARLLLVGKDPAPAVRALAGPTVEVTGTVPDVRPYLQRARVAVAPLLAGGGTRLKVLEALDAGRPVVGTSVGVAGLPRLAGSGVIVADAPAEMADALVTLLGDADRAAALGQAGHDAVGHYYSWDGALRPLFDRLDGWAA